MSDEIPKRLACECEMIRLAVERMTSAEVAATGSTREVLIRDRQHFAAVRYYNKVAEYAEQKPRAEMIKRMFEATKMPEMVKANPQFSRYWEDVHPVNRDIFLAAMADAVLGNPVRWDLQMPKEEK